MVRRRSIDRRRIVMLAAGPVVVLALWAGSAIAQTDVSTAAAESAPRHGVAKLIQAGGAVGYVIIALSVAGIALAVDAFIKLKEELLKPDDIKEMFEVSMAIYPEGAVEVGGSWSIQRKSAVGQMLLSDTRYELRKRKGGIAFVKATGTLRTPGEGSK